MTDSHPKTIEEYRIRASILLKSLRSGDLQQRLGAALRFQRLPHLSALSAQEITRQQDGIKLKHALNVLGLENDYASWSDMKHQLEQQQKREMIKSNNRHTDLYPRRCGGFVNAWYRSHGEARGHLSQAGGYLLPYKDHFFVCERDYIRSLGLDPDDPDWALIGWDWAIPADQDARDRLNARLQNQESKEVVR